MASSSGFIASSSKDGDRDVRIYENLRDLHNCLAEYILQVHQTFVKERGLFTMAFSDESLLSLIEVLSRDPYAETVDWKTWHIFWADARELSTHHLESFLRKAPVEPNQVYRIKEKVPREEAAAAYESLIRQLVKQGTVRLCETADFPEFDLVLLSMGADGHVASLFPDHPALKEKQKWVTFITDAPDFPYKRITFTMPVIISASNAIVVATGSDKANSVHRVIDEEPTQELAPGVLPAQLMSPYKTKWFLDKFAASKFDR